MKKVILYCGLNTAQCVMDYKMNEQIRIHFERFFSNKWNNDPNRFAYDDLIFKSNNDKYEHLYVQRAYEIFEAGFEAAKEIWNINQ